LTRPSVAMGGDSCSSVSEAEVAGRSSSTAKYPALIAI
jgi:hypothetical protein